MLDDAECEGARVARDPAYDGRFFTGCRTTGIYCRPVCPVRPAHPPYGIFSAALFPLPQLYTPVGTLSMSATGHGPPGSPTRANDRLGSKGALRARNQMFDLYLAYRRLIGDVRLV